MSADHDTIHPNELRGARERSRQRWLRVVDEAREVARETGFVGSVETLLVTALEHYRETWSMGERGGADSDVSRVRAHGCDKPAVMAGEARRRTDNKPARATTARPRSAKPKAMASGQAMPANGERPARAGSGSQ